MTGYSQPDPGERAKKSQKIKQRLIWLGIALGILAIVETGILVTRIINPSF